MAATQPELPEEITVNVDRVEDAIARVLAGESPLDEMALSSKHMRVVAGEISKIEDPGVRRAVGDHFSKIFSLHHDRFDADRFAAAANGTPSSGRDAATHRTSGSMKGGFTRQHFQQSASMLRDEPEQRRGHVARHVASIHGRMNQDFDMDRFRKAAGVHESLDEALKLIKAHGSGAYTAKVYKDPDYHEFRVKHFENGVHKKGADYHTNDVEDAHDTAKHFTNVNRNEGVDEAEVPMNFSFKKKTSGGPGMTAQRSRVEPDPKGGRTNVTTSQILPGARTNGKSYGLWKATPVGATAPSAATPTNFNKQASAASVAPVKTVSPLTKPNPADGAAGKDSELARMHAKPNTDSWKSTPPKPYKAHESLEDRAMHAVNSYVEATRKKLRETGATTPSATPASTGSFGSKSAGSPKTSPTTAVPSAPGASMPSLAKVSK